MSGGRAAWMLIGAVLVVTVGSGLLFESTVNARYERDVSRMVFNDNLDVLDGIKRRIGASTDTLKRILVDSTETAMGRVVAVLALAARGRGTVGQFGAVDAADGALPGAAH